ncbi:hypothetical protein GGR97_000528 [Wenyingzhuangia aestuarii]|nr:hypothetical protein [Wenyingzhuangia aestuarii]
MFSIYFLKHRIAFSKQIIDIKIVTDTIYLKLFSNKIKNLLPYSEIKKDVISIINSLF